VLKLRKQNMTEAQFVELLEQTYKNTNYLTKQEIPSKHGIADLVLVKINSSNRKLRQSHKQKTPLLNENYFKVLKHIPDRDTDLPPVDLAYLEKVTDLPRSYIRSQVLSHLKAEGYVVSEDGRYYKINGWVPIADEVIAIEAKLKDWRHGIIQANRYKSFANKVYLAVPPATAAKVDMDILRKFNIGLIEFDAEKMHKKTSYVRSRKQKDIIPERRNFVSEFFWAY
jgi:hypothetical protein